VKRKSALLRPRASKVGHPPVCRARHRQAPAAQPWTPRPRCGAKGIGLKSVLLTNANLGNDSCRRTTYAYNAAGDLASVTYSDGTPGVVYTYDRRGRLVTVARNGITTALTYNDANQPVMETHGGGTLALLSMNWSRKTGMSTGRSRRAGLTSTGWFREFRDPFSAGSPSTARKAGVPSAKGRAWSNSR